MEKSKNIQHLYWRAGFGLNAEEWNVKQGLSVARCVNLLFAEAKEASQVAANTPWEAGHRKRAKKLSKAKKQKIRARQQELLKTENFNWIAKMAAPDSSALLEKMTLFWHGHFACVFKYGSTAINQLNTIRTHALGNFKDLVLAIAKDPAMIKFLNNQQNKKRSPNENFARELLELFTIGRGNYQEKDIKEAARAFTGWHIDQDGKYYFREKHHDFGEKQFMGQTGNFDGEAIIDIVLQQKATAQFICSKIYRYFVNDIPDEKRIKTLANAFYESNYDIEKLMRTIFTSKWFYFKSNRGTKIKSPIELLVGIMRSLKVEFKEPRTVLFIQKALGQILLKPPNVAGWAGGKNWIDNSTLMLRLNMVTYLMMATEVDFKVKEEFEASMRNKRMDKIKATIDLAPIVDTFAKLPEDQVFAALGKYLLPIEVTALKNQILPFTEVGTTPKSRIQLLTMWLMSLPEYQLC